MDERYSGVLWLFRDCQIELCLRTIEQILVEAPLS